MKAFMLQIAVDSLTMKLRQCISMSNGSKSTSAAYAALCVVFRPAGALGNSLIGSSLIDSSCDSIVIDLDLQLSLLPIVDN